MIDPFRVLRVPALLLAGLVLLAPELAAKPCLVFSSPAELEQQRDLWSDRLKSLSLRQRLQWMAGLATPPARVRHEAGQQKDCLIHALRSEPGIDFPLRTISSRRDHQRQRAIWERKYAFRGSPFGRITPTARERCAELANDAATAWNPALASHAHCWRRLEPEQRQAEILQTSAPPGLTRHHWGTDFDLFDPTLSNPPWRSGGRLAAVYEWMRANAWRHGFFQPYRGGHGDTGFGYTEERWHWSYYPIAGALAIELADNSADFEALLREQLDARDQFGLVLAHWRDFAFGVEPPFGDSTPRRDQSVSTSSTSR